MTALNLNSTSGRTSVQRVAFASMKRVQWNSHRRYSY